MRLYQKLLITALLFAAPPLAVAARFGSDGIAEPVIMLLSGGGVAAAAALIRRHLKAVPSIHVTEG